MDSVYVALWHSYQSGQAAHTDDQLTKHHGNLKAGQNAIGFPFKGGMLFWSSSEMNSFSVSLH